MLVTGLWMLAIALGIAGSLRLTPLLSTGFSLPGTDSNRVKQILAQHYADTAGSEFVLVASGGDALALVERAGQRATQVLPDARLVETRRLPSGSAASFVRLPLDREQAAGQTGRLRAALGPDVHVTGDPAIAYDMGPVLARDLRVGELYLALPAALLILAVVFGTGAALLPFLFAAATIPPALGIVWLVAHVLELSDYLRNMVLMIGLGIAIDYSLLVVNRYREERRRGSAHAEAVAVTMQHAGRTIVFSGLAVSVGLVLMLLLPVPFLRGFGIGGLLVPLISVVCALTLLPVMLVTFGERLERIRVGRRARAERRHARQTRRWGAYAGWVMRRARLVAPVVATILLLAASPLLDIRVGPGSPSSLPKEIPAMQGLAILQDGGARGALDPTTIVVDTGRTDGDRAAAPALRRLTERLRGEAEVVSVSASARDEHGRFLRVDVVGRHDPASPGAQAFAEDVRSRIIPESGFPASATVLVGGGSGSAADFVSRTLGSLPWLVLGVLALTYLLLVRAFRSLLLPLKAILLNLMTVAAASGLMIAVFQWGWGSPLGLLQVNQIEGWIPVFMFALLFGLSMDYEVFLVSRMRETWDRTRSNTGAVVNGLASTGRIVTAAGLIMIATFSGLLLASVPPMQQLGFGLAAAILIDITLVRGLLLPSTMALAGRWNWYLPAWAGKALRIRS